MPPLTVTVILNEHRSLLALLGGMQAMLEGAHESSAAPDFAALRAMVFYLDEFPERQHHAMEDALLFPLLRKRCPSLDGALKRLGAEHARGEADVRKLGHLLLAWEVLGDGRREAFIEALAAHSAWIRSHIEFEESEILPACENHLRDDDWAVLDDAFGRQRDPVTGAPQDHAYRHLFRKLAPYFLRAPSSPH